MAIELVTIAKNAPRPRPSGRILVEARERGLILIKAGLYDNVIRLLMPLVTTDEEIAGGLDILETALDVVSNLSAEGTPPQGIEKTDLASVFPSPCGRGVDTHPAPLRQRLTAEIILHASPSLAG